VIVTYYDGQDNYLKMAVMFRPDKNAEDFE